jgi:hypothetical protein
MSPIALPLAGLAALAAYGACAAWLDYHQEVRR